MWQAGPATGLAPPLSAQELPICGAMSGGRRAAYFLLPTRERWRCPSRCCLSRRIYRAVHAAAGSDASLYGGAVTRPSPRSRMSPWKLRTRRRPDFAALFRVRTCAASFYVVAAGSRSALRARCGSGWLRGGVPLFLIVAASRTSRRVYYLRLRERRSVPEAAPLARTAPGP